MKNLHLLTVILVLILVAGVLAACSNDTAWRSDPSLAAARETCRSQSGLDYDCIERQAVDALNPDICRLAGIYIDDMCLQMVYEAADDPAICDQIYLQGVVPNCQAYYARQTTAQAPPAAILATPTHTQPRPPTITPIPSATPTSVPTSTPSPTPLFVFDLTRYDPDIFQPVVIEHQPPLIAQSDETVVLIFDVINTIYCADLQRNCHLVPLLYYSYEGAETYQAIPLVRENLNGMEPFISRLPAEDQTGRALRYYAEFALPEAGYSLRYPAVGTIDLFVAENFIPIELPEESELQTGEVIFDFTWGYGADKVLSTFYSPYGHRVGPPAMDVSSDGRIALIDPVNERIIVFDPQEGSYTSLPLPFTYKFNSNLVFDHDNRLMVCDFQGEEDQVSGVSIPHCYRLLPDGDLDIAVPLYAKFPEAISGDYHVLDGYDSRMVAPFSPEGEANDREAQRERQTWEFPYRYLDGVFTARFADLGAGLAFEVYSETGLGGLPGFVKTPQGYLLTFHSGFEQIRAVWIDPTGSILKDITLPNGQYSEMSFNGQTAVAPDGSLYVMSSTRRGIEIHYAAAPAH